MTFLIVIIYNPEHRTLQHWIKTQTLEQNLVPRKRTTKISFACPLFLSYMLLLYTDIVRPFFPVFKSFSPNFFFLFLSLLGSYKTILMFCNISPVSVPMIPFSIAAFSVFGRKSYVTLACVSKHTPTVVNWERLLKENCQGVQLGSIRSDNQRETCLWRPGGSLPYWGKCHTRVIFSSPHLPRIPGSSPVQAELGFSLGPQSRVCSQPSTSNTGEREGKASRREQRNTMGKANVLHLLWVIWSGVHFLVYIWNRGKKCQWNTGPKDKCSHLRILEFLKAGNLHACSLFNHLCWKF